VAGGGEGEATAKKRRPYRRDEILEAAVRLFSEKGYHQTGIDDIGAAAGITGPAIYRHFKSKEDILETLLLETNATAIERSRAIASDGRAPLEALRELVRLYVSYILDNPALSFVGMYERRTLQGRTRTAIERVERTHLETWTSVLTAVRPELTDAEARVLVRGCYGLAVSAGIYRTGLDRTATEELLVSMMLRALDVTT
jgi:AcrR family transcriptional regulator